MLLLCIGIALLGFLPLVIVLWKRKRVRKLFKTGELVSGEVMELNEFAGFKGSVYYKAIIRYPVAGQGMLQSSYSFTGTRLQTLFAKGQHVSLFYDKEKPQKIIPKDAPHNKVLLVFTIIIAIVYCILCFFLYDFINNQGA